MHIKKYFKKLFEDSISQIVCFFHPRETQILVQKYLQSNFFFIWCEYQYFFGGCCFLNLRVLRMKELIMASNIAFWLDDQRHVTLIG